MEARVRVRHGAGRIEYWTFLPHHWLLGCLLAVLTQGIQKDTLAFSPINSYLFQTKPDQIWVREGQRTRELGSLNQKASPLLLYPSILGGHSQGVHIAMGTPLVLRDAVTQLGASLRWWWWWRWRRCRGRSTVASSGPTRGSPTPGVPTAL